MPEVNFGVDSCFLWCIEEIGGEGEWVLVLLQNPVEAPEVDKKLKRAIFLADEKNWGSMEQVV